MTLTMKILNTGPRFYYCDRCNWESEEWTEGEWSPDFRPVRDRATEAAIEHRETHG